MGIFDKINKKHNILKETNKKERKISLKNFQGCLIGGAIGDALGYPIEFIKEIETIKSKYGQNGITRFELIDGKARISDDTQMTLFTANGLLWGYTRSCLKGISPSSVECIYLAYKNWHNTQLKKEYRKDIQNICWISHLTELNIERAPGMTCINSLSGDTKGTIESPINNSKGCGGVMRVAPIGLFYEPYDINDYETFHKVGQIAAESTALTHGHPLGIIPSYVFAILINILSNYDNISIEEALNIAIKVLNKKFKFYNKKTKKEFTNLINKSVELAYKNINDTDAIQELGEGWVAEEALAIAIYCCIKYSTDFEKAIICSVNHIGDSDSTGAIVGNIIGAYLGIDAIPEFYKTNLELRDEILEIATDIHSIFTTVRESSGIDKSWEKKYLYCDKNSVL